MLCFPPPNVYAVVDPVVPECDGALPDQSEGRHCNRLVLDPVQIPHLWAHQCQQIRILRPAPASYYPEAPIPRSDKSLAAVL